MSLNTRTQLYGMKWAALLLPLLSCVYITGLGAQECDTIQPPVCVCMAPVYCDVSALDEVCFEMGDFETPFDTLIGCPNATIDNPAWIAFVAGSDTLDIRITASDCEGLDSLGIQAALYTGMPASVDTCSDCDHNAQGLVPFITHCAGGDTLIEWTGLPVTRSHTYYLLVDGNGGDICHIDLDITQGADAPEVTDPVSFSYPVNWFDEDTLCAGETVPVTVGGVSGAARYIWTLPNGNIAQTMDSTVFVETDTAGNYVLCVYVLNGCDTSATFCDTIVADTAILDEGLVAICEGDTTTWRGQSITEAGIYFSTPDSVFDCGFKYRLTVITLNDNIEDPTDVDIIACPENAPVVYLGVEYFADFSGMVQTSSSEGCDSFINLTVDFLNTFPCNIYELEVTLSNCINDTFFVGVTLLVDSIIPCETRYSIRLNGDAQGTFDAANDPVVLGPLTTGSDVFTVNAFVINGSNCFLTTQFNTPICYDCQIDSLAVTVDSCSTESEYGIEVDLFPENPGDSFDVFSSNVYLGRFANQDFPLTLDSFPNNESAVDSLTICHFVDEDCCRTVAVNAPFCVFNECDLSRPEVLISCDRDSFLLGVDFDFQDTGRYGFDLFIDTAFLGNFHYAELPLTLGPFLELEQVVDVIVQDRHDPDCRVDTTLVIDCPECSIDIELEIVQCAFNNMTVELEIEEELTGEDGFRFVYNDFVLGTFDYGPDSFVIGPFARTEVASEFVVQDIEYPDCADTVYYSGLACDTCTISNLTVDTLGCTGDNLYAIELDFTERYPESEFFRLEYNGMVMGFFEYDSLPVTLGDIPSSGNAMDTFTVRDLNNEHCVAGILVVPPDCAPVIPCEIDNLVVLEESCENDSFVVRVDFDFQDPPSGQFVLSAGGMPQDTFNYIFLPVFSGPYSADSTDWVFSVRDLIDTACADSFELGRIVCDTCNLIQLSVDTGACTGDSAYVLQFNFVQAGPVSDSFTLFANGRNSGRFAYSELPLTLGNFRYDGGTTDVIRVCDMAAPDCCTELEFEVPQCLFTNVNELDRLDELKIYPNPVGESLYLDYSGSGKVDISIHRPSGALLSKHEISNGLNAIDMGAHSTGLYLILVKHESGLYYHKFVKIE